MQSGAVASQTQVLSFKDLVDTFASIEVVPHTAVEKLAKDVLNMLTIDEAVLFAAHITLKRLQDKKYDVAELFRNSKFFVRAFLLALAEHPEINYFAEEGPLLDFFTAVEANNLDLILKYLRPLPTHLLDALSPTFHELRKTHSDKEKAFLGQFEHCFIASRSTNITSLTESQKKGWQVKLPKEYKKISKKHDFVSLLSGQFAKHSFSIAGKQLFADKCHSLSVLLGTFQKQHPILCPLTLEQSRPASPDNITTSLSNGSQGSQPSPLPLDAASNSGSIGFVPLFASMRIDDANKTEIINQLSNLTLDTNFTPPNFTTLLLSQRVTLAQHVILARFHNKNKQFGTLFPSNSFCYLLMKSILEDSVFKFPDSLDGVSFFSPEALAVYAVLYPQYQNCDESNKSEFINFVVGPFFKNLNLTNDVVSAFYDQVHEQVRATDATLPPLDQDALCWAQGVLSQTQPTASASSAAAASSEPEAPTERRPRSWSRFFGGSKRK